ncbi:MAG: ATP-binding protein [Helicobacter sp.]|nr:ATP-binding protein [Helicobacter sp.]
MKTHGFAIRNFRNLGICEGNKSQEAFLRLSEIKGELGGLTILLGKSNSGKSNLLKALEKFGNSHLSLNGSQNLESLNLLSQDDIPNSQSVLPSIAFAHQKPAYYLQYPQDIAQKSGTAKKEQTGEVDLDEHLEKLQDDFDSRDVWFYFKRKGREREKDKLILDNSSDRGRIIECEIEPLKSLKDYPVDELNTEASKRLYCPFVVGYETLNAKQNFANYINDTSQPIQSSAFKENRLAICLDENQNLQQKYFVGNAILQGSTYVSLSSHQVQDISGTEREQLHIPKIVFYDETQFYNKDLSTTPDKIKESKLFRGGITKKLMQINHDFNALYGVQDGGESYRFELNIDIDKFALEIYRGEQALSLEKQGSGFKRLFNFIFSLAQQIDGLEKGDIMLIDDVEKSLSVPTQKRLRKYLRELAQKRGIFFIVSTHSSFMIDCNHLDEIRLLKTRDNGHGTEIVELENADGTFKKNELDYIADIVGVDYRDSLRIASKNAT